MDGAPGASSLVYARRIWRTIAFADYEMQYQKEEWIGFGASSIVYAALSIDREERGMYHIATLSCAHIFLNSGLVALKCMPASNFDEGPHLLREPELLQAISAEPSFEGMTGRVVRLYDAFFTTFPATDKSPEEENLVLVLELCKGDNLTELLAEEKRLPESLCKSVIRALCEVLGELHRLNFVHRDVKPGNIIVDIDAGQLRQLILLDFGFAKRLAENRSHAPSDTPLLGTRGFTPPEALYLHKQGKEMDVFAVGVTTFVCLVGYPPFVTFENYSNSDHYYPSRSGISASRERMLMRESLDYTCFIVDCKFTSGEGEKRFKDPLFVEQAWRKVSIEARRFCEALLDYDAATRPNFTEALALPFLRLT